MRTSQNHIWTEWNVCEKSTLNALSSYFMNSSIDQWILLDTASWLTLIFITRLRSLLRAESTTSFTEYAMSTSFKKSASSSCIDISSVKCTSNTRINESVHWCWKKFTRYAVMNLEVLSNANENESVHYWISDTRAWFEWQRDE